MGNISVHLKCCNPFSHDLKAAMNVHCPWYYCGWLESTGHAQNIKCSFSCPFLDYLTWLGWAHCEAMLRLLGNSRNVVRKSFNSSWIHEKNSTVQFSSESWGFPLFLNGISIHPAKGKFPLVSVVAYLNVFSIALSAYFLQL